MEYHYRVIFRDKRSFKLNNESFGITAIVLSLSLSLANSFLEKLRERFRTAWHASW